MARRLIIMAPLLLVALACTPRTTSSATPSVATSVPVIVAFTASPTAIMAGQEATLIWNVTNATGIQIDQGVGSGLAAAGTISVSPSVSTTYTLTASNSTGNVMSSVTVTVTSSSSTSPFTTPPPPSPSPGLPPNILVFDISPNTINVPPGLGAHSATMRWDVRNATNVTINGAPEPLSGSRVLTPPVGAHTYTLRATNAYGTEVRSQQLIVKP